MTEITTFSDSEIKSLLVQGAIDLDKLFQWWHASETHPHVSDTTRWVWWCDYGQIDYLYDELPSCDWNETWAAQREVFYGSFSNGD